MIDSMNVGIFSAIDIPVNASECEINSYDGKIGGTNDNCCSQEKRLNETEIISAGAIPENAGENNTDQPVHKKCKRNGPDAVELLEEVKNSFFHKIIL